MYNLIRIPENSLEHFLIAKNTHRWVNDASSVRRIDGEMDAKNNGIEINDYCSFALYNLIRIQKNNLNGFLIEKRHICRPTMRPQ